LLAVASGGGHWVQLLRLRPAFVGSETAYATVDAAYRPDVGADRFHIVPDATRWERLALLRLALRMAWIVLRERPDVVITTGAAPGYFALLFGRLLGARTVWLDSMANVDRLSLAGEKAQRFADMWMTQWPDLAMSSEGPIFRGSVA
jgi:UDP-N-acetylglucosamine:LPS N-acetylglucosamine transferase